MKAHGIDISVNGEVITRAIDAENLTEESRDDIVDLAASMMHDHFEQPSEFLRINLGDQKYGIYDGVTLTGENINIMVVRTGILLDTLMEMEKENDG